MFLAAPIDGAGFKFVCVEEMGDGTLRKANSLDCSEQAACIINGEVLDVALCDNTTGYGPKDLERVLTWGRRNCK